MRSLDVFEGVGNCTILPLNRILTVFASFLSKRDV
jgi:hypothetical protein